MKPFKIGHHEYADLYCTEPDAPVSEIILEDMVLRPIDAERLAMWLLKAAAYLRKVQREQK